MTQDSPPVLPAGTPAAPGPGLPRLLVAGAAGALGEELLHRLVGGGRFGPAQVLAREPITAAVRGIRATLVRGDDPGQWPPAVADVGLILFEPPGRLPVSERALWVPRPEQLPSLAAWMRRSGAGTLVVVLPHAAGRLPEALKRGLADLDEQAVATLGFDRLLIVRSAWQPVDGPESSWPRKLARAMLSIFGYMVPSSERPVGAARVAEFVDAALRVLPPGIHVAPPELVWQAAQGDADAVVARWLG